MASKGYTDRGTKRVSVYDPTLSSGYSSNLWKTCPLQEYLHDPMIGVLCDERWQSYNAQATTGDYVLTQATAGTGAISTAAPGVLELDCNSTTSTQGANLQRVKSAFVPAAGKHIWAEFKFKIVIRSTRSSCSVVCQKSTLQSSHPVLKAPPITSDGTALPMMAYFCLQRLRHPLRPLRRRPQSQKTLTSLSGSTSMA